MTLYHGSNTIIEKPTLIKTNRRLDFGPGFYTTSNQKQAESFARKVYERAVRDGLDPTGRYISIFEIDYDLAQKNLKILRFDSADEKWLDFVLANRIQTYTGEPCDIIYGPVANDTIFRTLIGYENGFFTKEQTINYLKVRKLFDQLTFKSEKSLSYLKYIGYNEVP